jgi:hypothetical protein
MPSPVTVWTVELVAGSSPEDVRGSLELAPDALVFHPRETELPQRRYPLREIVRVRRVRGSPVLTIVRQTDEGPRRTAFYFVPPPPLERPETSVRPSVLGGAKTSGRRVRRQNATYLGMRSRELKAVIRDWEGRVRAAAAAARGAAG